jgi:hypothetical protein
MFAALGVQHAMRMRHIVIRSLPGCTIFFSTLSHKLHDIWKKKLLNIKSVFWFSLQILSETFLILRRIQRDMIKNIYRSSCKVPVIIVIFWWNLNFLDRFSKNIKIRNFIKICWAAAELFHTDRRPDANTWRSDTVDFRNFANALKNYSVNAV